MKQRGFRYCTTCSTKLQKRGMTAAGTQRWFCVVCSKSAIRPRPDLTEGLLLERFVAWLLGKNSQEELLVPARTWRDHITWCWEVVPKPATPNLHESILLDGIRIGTQVCLIAKTTSEVIAWVWVGWESSYTWELLLSQTPAPTVVVCDGQKGMLLAIARCWPHTRIQRCLFHVWQNIRAKLSLHPSTLAGRALLQLTRSLWQVDTLGNAGNWVRDLDEWEKIYGSYTKEQTYAERLNGHTPRWWYSHGRLRSSYRQLRKLQNDRQLFTYLEDLTSEPIPRTTNHVEGGINSQLRTLLKLHRGLSQAHQQRLVDWYLYSRTKDPKPPRNCR
jgi:hypothetical protein